MSLARVVGNVALRVCDALTIEALPTLPACSLSSNSIGDAGCSKVAEALAVRASLHELLCVCGSERVVVTVCLMGIADGPSGWTSAKWWHCVMCASDRPSV